MKKRILSLLLALPLALDACGAANEGELNGGELLSKVTQTNMNNALLEKYDSVSYDCNWYNEDGSWEMHSVDAITKDKIFYRTDEIVGEGLYEEGSLAEQTMSAYTSGTAPYQWVFPERDDFISTYQSKLESLVLMVVPEEKIESVTEEDSITTLVTSITKEVSEAQFGDASPEMRNGDRLCTEYRFDPETLEIQGMKMFLWREDGTKTVLSEGKMFYNVAPPKAPQTYKDAFDSAETVTLTLVFDPDTDSERTQTFEVTKGVATGVSRPEEYISMFADWECTQAYAQEGFMPEEDMTLYFVAGK